MIIIRDRETYKVNTVGGGLTDSTAPPRSLAWGDFLCLNFQGGSVSKTRIIPRDLQLWTQRNLSMICDHHYFSKILPHINSKYSHTALVGDTLGLVLYAQKSQNSKMSISSS